MNPFRWLALLGLILGAAQPLGAAAEERGPFHNGHVSFSARVGNEIVPYRVFAAFVLPGRRLGFEILDPGSDVYTLEAPAGTVRIRSAASWEWEAPRPAGMVPITLTRAGGDRMTIHAFVMVPRSEISKGALNGYRIGEYPSVALKGLDIYRPPAGFVEVRPGMEDIPVSPHFTLGQFLCKQDAEFPKYVVLRSRLVAKLEMILEVVNQRGIRCDTFHVMSGYRTPFYNKAIGNVQYSRHVWGGAADIFVDESPRDGVMDDLNQDGRIDVEDAGVLYDWVDELYGKPVYERFVGGLGRYRRNAAHGPFVHVDVRGFRARWGT